MCSLEPKASRVHRVLVLNSHNGWTPARRTILCIRIEYLPSLLVDLNLPLTWPERDPVCGRVPLRFTRH